MACRYKGTIICQEVAKAKNVCQVKIWVEATLSLNTVAFYSKITFSTKNLWLLKVCLLDLDYNLPVQVRDSALGLEDEVLPDSDVGKEFALERMANEGQLGAAYDTAKPNDTVMRLQRTTPYYQACP